MNDPSDGGLAQLRHYGGFVLAGLVALCIDAVVLTVLTEAFGMSPYIVRLISISIAMIASWQINRRLTFAVTTPATFKEFGKFAAVSWVAQAVNYAIFAAILLMRPQTWPVAALVAASGLAMFVAYGGFRFGVFRKH